MVPTKPRPEASQGAIASGARGDGVCQCRGRGAHGLGHSVPKIGIRSPQSLPAGPLPLAILHWEAMRVFEVPQLGSARYPREGRRSLAPFMLSRSVELLRDRSDDPCRA
jgi:hypothetical protein